MTGPAADLLHHVLSVAQARAADHVELFCEDTATTTILVEDDRVDRCQFGRDRGAALRATRDGATTFASVDGWQEQGLVDAALALSGSDRRVRRLPPRPAPPAAPAERLDSALVAIALRANASARAYGDTVRQVTVRATRIRQHVTIAGSDLDVVHDERALIQLSVAVTAERAGTRQVGRRARGGQAGIDLLDNRVPEEVGASAAQAALTMLDARPARAGTFPVIIANGWGGVLFHEAVGHGLEGDHAARSGSVYAARLGTRVAPEHVSLMDDATVPGHRGSYRIDDEGTPSQRTLLIDRGILVGFLTDRKHAALLNAPRSGNARRQSFQYPPIPRMSNLFLQPGQATPQELIRETAHGVYVASLGGGQVDPASGQFVFSVTEGYEIENGAIGTPIRGANIAGTSLAVLEHVDGVANDFQMDPGLGNCGKLGQWVPVGVGQPTIRIREMIVGGTHA
ncbi:MAG: TldD/PmbA family protein [Chloroflexota bacterium]